MARVCPKYMAPPGDCWCPAHRSPDRDENERRRIIGTAAYEWKGGEALHVFVDSKEGGEVSLCNLRRALPADEVARQLARKKVHPSEQCVQCGRTLASRVPNARMRRYLLGRRTAGN